MSWECVSYWIKHHPGLASWVQAVGSIAAIIGAFAISNSQQKRQLALHAKATKDKSEAFFAVIQSAAHYSDLFGQFAEKYPTHEAFAYVWKTTYVELLTVLIDSLRRLPAHELGAVELVTAHNGVLSSMISMYGKAAELADRTAFTSQDINVVCGQISSDKRMLLDYWENYKKGFQSS